MKKCKMLLLALTTLLVFSIFSLTSGQAVKVFSTTVATAGDTYKGHVQEMALQSKVNDSEKVVANLSKGEITKSVTTAISINSTVPFVDANGKTIGSTVTRTNSPQSISGDSISNAIVANNALGTMKGIDVYSGTTVTDWNAVKNAGVQAVYIKLTDGTTYNNPSALAQYNGAKSAGLKVGAYHFAEDNDVDAEYNHFETQYCKYQWDLKPVLDYEVNGNTDYNYISRYMAKDQNLIYYGSHSTADSTGLPISRIWIAEPSDLASGSYAFTGTTKGYAGIQYLWHGSINGLQGDASVDLFSSDILLSIAPVICVDTPHNGDTANKSVNVAGWALNISGNKQVDILVDGTESGNTTVWNPRTDVLGYYPSYGITNSGFSYSLDTSSLSPGKHTITVKATGNDGSSTTENINIVK